MKPGQAPEEQLEFINVVPNSGLRSSPPPSGSINYDNSYPTAQDNSNMGFIRQSQHPVAAFFHYAFKVTALVLYIFSGLVSSNFVFVCVVCILLLAFDFWTVKNISGRLMVGLRWWSNVKEDGTNEWVFESLENMGEVNKADSKLFWLGLYVTPLLWGGLFIIGLLKFNLQWLVIVMVALLLSGANIVGYTKCSNDAKHKVSNFVQDVGTRATVAALGNSNVRNAMFSFFAGGGGAGGNQAGGAPPGHMSHV